MPNQRAIVRSLRSVRGPLTLLVLLGATLAFTACFDDDDDAPGADKGSPDGSTSPDGGRDLLKAGDGATSDAELEEDAGPPCDPTADAGPTRCVWQWQTPSPTGESLTGVHAFATDDIFALAGRRLLHRDASGWSYLPLPLLPVANDFAGSDGGHLYLMNRYGSVFYHSPDRGMTWQSELMPSLTRYKNLGAERVSGWVVAAAEASGLAVRNPATKTWTPVRVDANNLRTFESVSLTPTRWVAVGRDTGAYGGIAVASPSAPTSWTVATLPPATPMLWGACSGTTGTTTRSWAVGELGVVLRSTDGVNWSKTTVPFTPTLNGCAAIDANTAIAFGAKGSIFRTADGGATWTFLPPVTWAYDSSWATVSPVSNDVTIVGFGGMILRVLGGTTLTGDSKGPNDNWEAITAASSTDLFASGAGGAIARTTNGRTWQRLSPGAPTANLKYIWAASPTDVYAVGNAPGDVSYVYHTTDGVNFTRYTSPATGGLPAISYLTGVAGMNANRVFISSTTGVYRSIDGGVSWQPLTIPGLTGQVTAVFANAAGVWIGGAGAKFFHSTDGENFTAHHLPPDENVLYVQAIFGDAAGNVYVTQEGTLTQYTANAEFVRTVVTGVKFAAVAFTPSGAKMYGSVNIYGWGAERLRGVLMSTDKAETFTAPFPELTTQIVGLVAVGENNVYAIAGGNGSGIIHLGNY